MLCICSVGQTFKLGQKEYVQMMCKVDSAMSLLLVGRGRVMAAVWSMSGLSVPLVSAVVHISNSSIKQSGIALGKLLDVPLRYIVHTYNGCPV